jgi:amino acid adenylation domain-containing protein
MSDALKYGLTLAPEQQAIRDKCFHPSGTFVEFPMEEIEQSIPERFEKIVSKYPDRIAIKLGEQSLTYAELNAKANRLAHSIVDWLGDEAEPVAILLETGPTLMAATLGALKAGKFVVLLDPSFPESRNAAILEDSRAKVVISGRQNAPFVSRIANRGCQLIDFESASLATSDDDLRLSISPKALAFLIYTSGSTGQPKGVMQDHRSRLHQCMWSTNTYHICSHDRSSLLTSGNSNAMSISLRTLLNGAMLLPFDVRREGVNRLASWLLRERISVCVMSSPLFRNLCETLTGEEGFPDLRLIRLSSETAYKSDFDLYKKYFPSKCLLANGLSPSEAGALTDYLMDQETEIPGNEIPVGYPLEDIEILLLDDGNKEVGPNQVGEIAVKSRYLSSGYWRRAALTEAKFRPEPEGNDRRLYLTGDLGLMLPDGCLLHKGRKDFRVKIRGFGVEIAEVENVLRDYAAINDGVVVARQNETGEARLVAYFTSPNRPGPSVSELRRFLKDKLPDYMIPSAFVMLDVMPLTPSGKVDREALFDPKDLRRELNTPLVAPRTSKEEKLVKIWAEELRIDQIGVHDNFFDLGGDSLIAMGVISQMRDDLQIELSLSRFFETPTVAALAAYIDTVRSPRDGAEVLSIQRASRDGQLLPSFAQQSLWFINQLEPRNPAYNLFSATELRGPLNVMALEQSFNEIIRRHEALRTVFQSVNGQPFQVILPALTINIPVVDLRDIASATEREPEIRRLSVMEAQRPFDLDRGPLLRVTLLRSTEETYVLLLVVHHIIFDGLSRGVLYQELAVIYAAFSSGQSPSLPPLPIQYVDFAQWQRQALQDRVLEEQLTYWTKRLENLSILKLPTDRPRPAVQTFRGARQSFTLSEDLFGGLKRLGRREGVTLFMTLFAAYLTLMHRYTGQNDIGIGSPISGRNRSELEGLIGFFLNMLVLRTDLSGNPTFRELLSRAREVCLEAYANQDVPFEKLVQELRPQRSLSHNPLFQATFALQNTPTCPLKLAGVTAEDLDLGSGIASFDLHLFMIEDETILNGWLVYNTDLFDASSIARMVGHFQMILEGIVTNPDQRISDLPLLAEAEKHQLLVEWNDTDVEGPQKCIHQWFEARVERKPDAVALVCDDQRLTYEELNRRANQVAHYLRKNGVGAEVLVAIYVERSIEMIVGLLGILKAGGAYVPLDPCYPSRRLEFMVADAQPAIVLTQRQLIQDARWKTEGSEGRASVFDPRLRLIFLDEERREIEGESGSNPESDVNANHLAYVVYTSGSTGTPKGVSIEHGGLCNLANEQARRFDISPADRVLQFASLSFDASIFEIASALTAGATLYLTAAETPLAGPALTDFLRLHEITVATLPPSVLATLSADELPALRLLCVAGEVCSAKLVEQWASGRRFFNLYGPTEATVWATTADCSDIPQRVSIGRPIANARVYLLDAFQNPVPIGVVGEIHIGGDGVARGYLNRPELTAERFIYHSFDGEQVQRLYRTGDLARYLPDGNIEFLGRTDNQVKIRGYRIELGEIEAVLAQHPRVRESIVIASEDSGGDKRLVAYIVPRESAPTTNELRAHLKVKLPDYVVPSLLVFLDTLPLTRNGKVDHSALPSPDRDSADLERLYIAPRNASEQAIANIWVEILGVKRIGVHDNFFDLGGHSLKATQVVSRLLKAFQREIPLRHLFEFPTIAKLAAVIDSKAIDGLNSMSEVEERSGQEVREPVAQKAAARGRD